MGRNIAKGEIDARRESCSRSRLINKGKRPVKGKSGTKKIWKNNY